MHRSDRFAQTTKLDRDKQRTVESHRRTVAFTLRNWPNHTPAMRYFACSDCHIVFGTAWLDRCPLCGSPRIIANSNLVLGGAN